MKKKEYHHQNSISNTQKQLHSVAFFDVDGTILRGQSQKVFFWHLWEQGLTGTMFSLRLLLWTFLYRFGIVNDPHAIMRYACRALSGRTTLEVDNLTDQAFLKIRKTFFQQALDVIHEHKKKGHLVVFISNAPDFIIRRIANFVCADTFFAASVLIKNDIYTGEISYIPHAREKATIVDHFLKEHPHYKETYGYGDHITDFFFLEKVKNAFVVNPNTKLLKEVTKRGWQPLYFIK